MQNVHNQFEQQYSSVPVPQNYMYQKPPQEQFDELSVLMEESKDE